MNTKPVVHMTKAELNIVRLVGAVQFINILDFMMVMPLGPDFATALSIPTNQIGYVGGAYTAAAFLSGLIGSLYLDRLDRRKALGFAMAGLVLSTALGGLAIGLKTLILARVLAGLFGGPATSLSLAIIADSVAVERRGRAMGMVGGAFSAAAVLGVPIGLKLAELGGWRMPFFAVASLGVLIIFAVIRIMQPQRAHLGKQSAFNLKTRLQEMREIASRRSTLLAMSGMIIMLLGNFLLVPNLSAYFQFNLGFPRAHLAWLYAAGGFFTFFSSRLAGRLVDRYGATPVAGIVSILLCGLLYCLFIDYNPALPVLVLFPLFMMLNMSRFITMNTTISKVPSPQERAGFMSLMAAAQHFASSTAAFLSSLILVELPGGSLAHIPRLGVISMIAILIIPFMVYRLERLVRQRLQDTAVKDEITLTAFE